jgi:hypothetical protein
MKNERLVMIGIRRKGCKKFTVQTDNSNRRKLNEEKKQPIQPEKATRQGEQIGKNTWNRIRCDYSKTTS